MVTSPLVEQPTDRRAVLVTADGELRDDLLRLAAAAGTEVVVASTAVMAVPAWRTAPVVLVGADLVGALVVLGLPRRAGVAVVSRGAVAEDPAWWRDVVDLGAGTVLHLPQDETPAVRLLSDVDTSDTAGQVVAVLGGRGGAGASVLAAGLCLAAVRAGDSALLVDLDPWGGGADLLLGAERVAGLRWRDLAGLSGAVSGTVLREAVPRPYGVGVVAWDRDASVTVSPTALRAVLESGTRRHELVVVDLPRRPDELTSVVLARACRTFVVVPAEVRSAAAAAQTVAALLPGADAHLVVRTGRGRSLEPGLVASALGLPLGAVVPDERQVTVAVEAGDPPSRGRRGSLARVCEALVRQLRENRDAAPDRSAGPDRSVA